MSGKSTRRALLTSALAILACAAMLIGTTFAWFTDTASTAVNKIQAGNLDVKLMMLKGSSWVSAEGETLTFKTKDNRTTDKILWEPGCTYKLPALRIDNRGNLALKYKIIISGIEGDAKLNEAIEWKISDGLVMGGIFHEMGDASMEGVLYPGPMSPGYPNATNAFVISGHMKEDAGNEYQGLSIEGIGITVVATQYTYEYDSYTNEYDKNATYPVIVTRDTLNSNLTLAELKDENGNISPVEVTLGETPVEDIAYSEHATGYTGKGVMLGSTNLNKYAATPAAAGEYKFTFKDGTITSTATGYGSIDNYKNTSVYMLVPGNSDVVFENMTFNGVVSFDIQKYTSPWSNLNSISFKNCIFNGIIIGTCPASNVTFDGCTFNAYTNTESANNSNPVWWREDTEGSGANANPIKTFTFVNNKVTGTRPVKIERIGYTVSPIFTIKNNTFDISKQAGDDTTKNMAINIGMGENPKLPFTLIDEGNTISSNTAALYTASITNGSNQYKEISGMKVLDGNGNNKVITAMVWKTTTGETFQMKTID